MHGRLFRPSAMRAILFVFLIFAGGVPVSASSLYIVSNGEVLSDSYAPVFTENGFAVPVELASEFGAEVHATESGFVVSLGDRKIVVTPERASVSRGAASTEVKPVAIGDSLFLPLQFMANFLNLKVSWDVKGNRLDLAPWAPLPQATPSNGREVDRARPTVNLVIDPEPAAKARSGDQVAAAPGVSSEGLGEAESVTGDGPLVAGDGPQGGGRMDRPARRPAAVLLIPPLDPTPEAPSAPPEPERWEWTELFAATGLHFERSAKGGKLEYILSSDRAISVETAFLVDPYRLIVDVVGVPGAEIEPVRWETEGGVVRSVRTAVQGENLRLIFDLEKGVGHRLDRPSDTSAAIGFFQPMKELDVAADPLGGRIQLDIPGETRYEVHRLVQPARAVIDLFDTTLIAGPIQVELEEGPVLRVRAAQFQPGVTRVVMDLKEEEEATPVRVVSVRAGLFAIEYGEDRRPIAYRHASEREVHLRIRAPEGSQASTHRLTHPDRLVIDIKPMRLVEVPEDVMWLDGPVSGLRASQYDDETVRIVADLRRYVRYGVFSEGRYLYVVMQQPLLTGKTVTIDAGHGGRDVGAIGVNLGLLEKDVNLDIAKHLEALVLKAEGRSLMTRDEDVLPFLEWRPDLAEEEGSDVFVSIHSNSTRSGNKDAQGTETYVEFADSESMALGRAVHTSLVSALGSVDRGLREGRHLLVLRNSELPATLVEVGFLSNFEEEELLNEPWYRRFAAEGIFNGLLKYFHPSDRLPDADAIESVRAVASTWIPVEPSGSQVAADAE